MGLYDSKTYDNALLLKAAALVAATAAESTVLDLGPGFVDADLVLDVTALEVADGNEIFTVALEGSNVAGMASGSVVLAQKVLGNNPAPADADTAVGRHTLPFRNEVGGTLYRYVRIHTTVAGTVGTGINYSAFIAKK